MNYFFAFALRRGLAFAAFFRGAALAFFTTRALAFGFAFFETLRRAGDAAFAAFTTFFFFGAAFFFGDAFFFGATFFTAAFTALTAADTAFLTASTDLAATGAAA